MSDLSFALLSWLKETGKIPDVGGFIEVDDHECIIEAFMDLFPEIQLNENELTKSFLKYIVNNKPKELDSLVAITYEDFVNCVPDVLEEISKIIIVLFKKKDEKTLMEQIDNLDTQAQEDLKMFFAPKINESEELSKLSEQIRAFSLVLENNLALQSEIEQLDKKNESFFIESDGLVQDKKQEANQEISVQKRSLDHLLHFNQIRERGVKKLEDQINELTKEISGKSEKLQEMQVRLISQQQRLKDQLAPYETLEEKIKSLEMPYSAMVREFMKKEEEIKKLKAEKLIEEKKLKIAREETSEIEIQKDLERMEKAKIIVELEKQIRTLDDLWKSNIYSLEGAKKTGKINDLIQQLILARTLRNDMKKKLITIRQSTLHLYASYSQTKQ